MVLFSELAPYGPLPRFAQPFPNDALDQRSRISRALRDLADPRLDVRACRRRAIYNTSA
jgi:hypothetical protein